MLLLTTFALVAQAAPVDSRQDTVRAALMATFHDDASSFATLVSKGAQVVNSDGKSALLNHKSFHEFTSECTLANWGYEVDRKWNLFWLCPNNRNVEMSFAFQGNAISHVDLLLAPPTLRKKGAGEPPVVHFPETGSGE